jgi:hypothetical protein
MQPVAFVFVSALGLYLLVMSDARLGVLLRIAALVTLEACLILWAVGLIAYPALETSGPGWLKAVIDDFLVTRALMEIAGGLWSGVSILFLAVVPPMFVYLEIQRLRQGRK